MLRLVTILLLSTAAFVFAEEDEPTYVIRRTRQAPPPVESSKLVFLSSVDHIPNSEANKKLVQRQAGPGYQTPPIGVPVNEYLPNAGQNAGSSPVNGAVAQFSNAGQEGELTSGTGQEGDQSQPAGTGGSGRGNGGLGSNQSGGGSEGGSGDRGAAGSGAEGGSGAASGVGGAAEGGSASGAGSGGPGGARNGAGGGSGASSGGGEAAGGGASSSGGASATGSSGGSSGGAASVLSAAAGSSSKPSGPFHGDAASLEKGDYSFGERQNLPPGCFINESGFVCCNRQLNDQLLASVKRISSDPKYSKCAIQKLVNTLHKDVEGVFKMDLKSLVGLQDYAQRVRFRGNMICKVEAGERFIISYAGPGPLVRRKRDTTGFNETAEFGDLEKITSMLF